MKTKIGQTYLVQIKPTFRKHKASWYNGMAGALFFAEYMGVGEYKDKKPFFSVKLVENSAKEPLLMVIGRKTHYILHEDNVNVLCHLKEK